MFLPLLKGKSETNLEKQNLMAASCPEGLPLTHILLLCASDKDDPSVGQVQPCARAAELG